MNSLPKTVTRQRRDCDLNPGPSAPKSSTLTTVTCTKTGEDWTCSFENMIEDRHTHAQTDTLITILRSPIVGGVTSGRYD